MAMIKVGAIMLNNLKHKYIISNIIFLMILFCVAIFSSVMLKTPILQTYIMLIAICFMQFLITSFEFYITLNFLKVHASFIDLYKSLNIVLMLKFILSGIFRLILNNYMYLYRIINNLIMIFAIVIMMCIVKAKYNLNKKDICKMIIVYIIVELLLIGITTILRIFVHNLF